MLWFFVALLIAALGLVVNVFLHEQDQRSKRTKRGSKSGAD